MFRRFHRAVFRCKSGAVECRRLVVLPRLCVRHISFERARYSKKAVLQNELKLTGVNVARGARSAGFFAIFFFVAVIFIIVVV